MVVPMWGARSFTDHVTGTLKLKHACYSFLHETILIAPNLLSPYNLRMRGRKCAPSHATPSTRPNMGFIKAADLQNGCSCWLAFQVLVTVLQCTGRHCPPLLNIYSDVTLPYLEHLYFSFALLCCWPQQIKAPARLISIHSLVQVPAGQLNC